MENCTAHVQLARIDIPESAPLYRTSRASNHELLATGHQQRFLPPPTRRLRPGDTSIENHDNCFSQWIFGARMLADRFYSCRVHGRAELCHRRPHHKCEMVHTSAENLRRRSMGATCPVSVVNCRKCRQRRKVPKADGHQTDMVLIG